MPCLVLCTANAPRSFKNGSKDQLALKASSWWPVLLVALLTINGPAPVRREGDLGLLATIGTNCIVHFSWASAEATTSFSIHVIHVPLRVDIKEHQWYISVWMEPNIFRSEAMSLKGLIGPASFVDSPNVHLGAILLDISSHLG